MHPPAVSDPSLTLPRRLSDDGSGVEVRFADEPGALLSFGFAPASQALLTIACPRLAGPHEPEAWLAGALDMAGAEAGQYVRRGTALAAVAVGGEEDQTGLAAATERAYRRLLAQVRGSAQPHIIRIWNYFAGINDGEGDAERYRRFCIGRAAAVDAAFNDPPPAATAIGTAGEPGALQVIALCSNRPGIALENPRQTPAWQYPREYGPVPPGFSRGALIGSGAGLRLLASGTASIVGHLSRHPGDVQAQLRESLRNLEALLAVGTERSGRGFALPRCEAARVYLRRSEDLAAAQTIVAGSGLPPDRVLYLRGGICRRELLVELEGVFAPL